MTKSMEWTYRQYTFRVVDKFPEPTVAHLMQKIFFEDFPAVDARQLLTDWERQRDAELKEMLKNRYFLRILVTDGDAVIGWTSGWQDTENRFYMGTSAVLPEYRRQGIYQELLRAVLRITKEQGFQLVHSNHLAGNNAVIIAKLKAGFVITGMEMLEWAGLMVKTTFFHNPTRAEVYRYRVGMARPPEIVKKTLGS